MIVNANSGRKQEKFRHRLRWQNACTSCLKKMLTKRVMFVILIARGISAVGSAQHWQCWGHGFESRMLHQKFSGAKRPRIFTYYLFALRFSLKTPQEF